MASTTQPPPPPYNGGHDQILAPSDGAAMSTPSFRPPQPPSSLSSSPSHSSNSSFGSLSFHDCQSPIANSTPATPLHFQGGVPFSWEQIPGIPKKSNANNSRHSSPLPLPPAGTPCSITDPFKNRPPVILASPKKLSSSSFRNDPFFAALVTCSKDDRHGEKSSKVTRSISHRFGFISFYASCKTTCAVSESIAYFPRSRNYDDHLLNRRSRR